MTSSWRRLKLWKILSSYNKGTQIFDKQKSAGRLIEISCRNLIKSQPCDRIGRNARWVGYLEINKITKSHWSNISLQKLKFSKSRTSKIANSLSLKQCDFDRSSSIWNLCNFFHRIFSSIGFFNDKKNRDESLFFWFSQQMRALAKHELMKNLIQRRKTMQPNRGIVEWVGYFDIDKKINLSFMDL